MGKGPKDTLGWKPNSIKMKQGKKSQEKFHTYPKTSPISIQSLPIMIWSFSNFSLLISTLKPRIYPLVFSIDQTKTSIHGVFFFFAQLISSLFQYDIFFNPTKSTHYQQLSTIPSSNNIYIHWGKIEIKIQLTQNHFGQILS